MKTNKFTTEKFVEKAKKVHGDKYDYLNVNYLNIRTKVKIICPIHGEFEQKPTIHLSGHGCSSCAGNKRITKDDFLNKVKLIHGNKYDYSKMKYINATTKIKIICPFHGEFKQTPSKHLIGHNCPECSQNKPYTTKTFISKAKKIHKNKYDYSKVNCNGILKKVVIICSEHGEFQQRCSDHLKGKGCPKCAGKNRTTNDFIVDAKKIHENKYDYSKTEYINTRTKIIIICPKHGEFIQIANSHLNGYGCPQCGYQSFGEAIIVEILKENNIEFERQKTFKNCKRKKKLRFDFYIPKLNCCIEYDGKQHYKPIDVFGGENGFLSCKINDSIKNKYCKDNNIFLHRIKYNDNIAKKMNKIFKFEDE